MDFKHISVMLDECIEGLNVRPDKIYVDGTAGGAGHSFQIASRLENGRLIALDQDPDAVITASQRLQQFKTAKVFHQNFKTMDTLLDELEIDGVDGILLDLGVSSHQLDEASRGFSYNNDAPLDMRMSQEGLSAYDIVNSWTVEEITRVIREYGEENFAWQIAKNICAKRTTQPIKTTLQLADIVKMSVPAAKRREKNPCKKTFQAIRIAVNDELISLSMGIEAAFNKLNSGGRLVILTFHSLEDRIVKVAFNEWCRGCTCPSEFPVCICNNKPKAKLINRKPIIADEKEQEENPRSRSAKLRILEKL